MKLSKKGYEKLFEFFMSGKYFDATKCDQIEFEPDDFDGYFQNGKDHVVFNIEEADDMRYEFKILTEAMDDLNYEFGTRFYTDDAWEELKLLKQRIEQAEKCDVENSR